MQVGISYKDKFYNSLTTMNHQVDFVEHIFENLAFNEFAIARAAKLREFLPCTIHCTSLNIGGETPLDFSFLEELKRVRSILKPFQISDHLCFTAHAKVQHHDLLPIKHTRKNLTTISSRVGQLQDFLQERIALENLSTYLVAKDQEMTELEFLNDLAKQAGSQVLLDLNNLEVNRINHGKEANLKELNPDSVAYIHVAGFEMFDGAAIDTHGAAPSEKVMQALHNLDPSFGETFLLEWDQNIPSFEEIHHVAAKIKRLRRAADV